jgi:hypothetical protein
LPVPKKDGDGVAATGITLANNAIAAAATIIG